MNASPKGKFVNVVFYCLLFAVLGGAVYFLYPKYNEMSDLGMQRDNLLQKIAHKQRETEHWKLKLSRAKHEKDFFEPVAREMRRVKQNDLLFVIEDDAKK